MSRSRWEDSAFAEIEKEVLRILEVRPSLIRRESEAWYGRTLALENTGRCSVAFEIEWRTYDLTLSFFSPDHLTEDGTFVHWPNCDNPYHSFALWEVLRARSLPYEHVMGRVKSWEPEDVATYTRGGVDSILESCLPIIDGDLSVTEAIAYNRKPPSPYRLGN